MAGSADPGTQRRKIGIQLRRLRRAKSLTQREAAENLEWSQTKIIRIENGGVSLSVTDLHALLTLYEVTDREKIDYLAKLARGSHGKSWAETYRDLITSQYAQYLALEGSASSILAFHPFLIPGLLQTEEYALALAASHQESDQNHRLAELRIRRQQRVFGEPSDTAADELPDLVFLVNEEALHRWIGGPDVMTRQLEHLLEVAKLPNASIHVIPYRAGAHPGLLGPSILLRFSDDEVVIFNEGAGEEIVSGDDPKKIADYVGYIDTMRALALLDGRGEELIKEMISFFAKATDLPSAAPRP